MDPRFMQNAFPLQMISDYLGISNTMFRTEIFHQSQLLQGDLLEIFLKFHLMADFKFQLKIDCSQIKIVDPLTRIKIRQKTQENEYIPQKYLGESFNIKKFVFQLYEKFFNFQKLRYIEQDHILQRVIFQITEFMFQVGLWTYENHE